LKILMSQHQQAPAVMQQQHQVAAQLQMHRRHQRLFWVVKVAAHLDLALAAAAQQQQVLAAAAAAADAWPNRHPARIRRPGSLWCCAVGMHSVIRASASG
jgi:hypothetical protein